jgi:FADH2 O2-dependent halogenase
MSGMANQWVGGGVVDDKNAVDNSATPMYDVAIIGAGFEGALLGLILAKYKAKVLIIEAGTHPRFALGESTVRHTFRMMKIIGERFDIPEIKNNFSSGEQVHKYVSAACGEKRNFGFVYHRKGQHQVPDEANQLVIPPFREGYEAHLLRQDTDEFLTKVAIHYGATVKFKTLVTDVEIDKKEGVTMKTAKGQIFKCRYLLDGSGTHSLLARKMGLKEETPRFQLKSRCLFNHLIDVKPYDDLNLPNGVPKAPERWYAGTCHHIFDGGWMWVIPFDNREGSTNKACSIGVSFDMTKIPKPNMTPDQEWEQFLNDYPSIKAQFADAKPIRDWISTDRLQISCKHSVGERFMLLPSAYGSGFADALFSRGLATCVEVAHALIPRLLKALKDDDFSPERFEYVHQVSENSRSNNDKIVHHAYICFKDWKLWNAWFRIWALGVGLGDLRLASIWHRYAATHDESILPDAEEPMGLFYSNHKGFEKLFNQACAYVDDFQAGKMGVDDTANAILKLLADCKFASPGSRLGDASMRYINFGSPSAMAGALKWVLTSAPPEIKHWTLTSLGPLKHLAPKAPMVVRATA